MRQSAHSETSFEVTLYPGSPFPFILKTCLLPSSVSTIYLQSNHPFCWTVSEGPSPGLGKKGFTSFLRGDNKTNTDNPVKIKDLNALNQFEWKAYS